MNKLQKTWFDTRYGADWYEPLVERGSKHRNELDHVVWTTVPFIDARKRWGVLYDFLVRIPIVFYFWAAKGTRLQHLSMLTAHANRLKKTDEVPTQKTLMAIAFWPLLAMNDFINWEESPLWFQWLTKRILYADLRKGLETQVVNIVEQSAGESRNESIFS